MKTHGEKIAATRKGKVEIKTDGPLSEKDEVKKAEDKMREKQPEVKGK